MSFMATKTHQKNKKKAIKTKRENNKNNKKVNNLII